MKSKLLSLGLAAPILCGGVLLDALSAQAITLNTGDRLDVAGEVTFGPGQFFFTPPSGAIFPSNFVVTGGTGGFTPFTAIPNGPDYQVTDLNLNPGGGQFNYNDPTAVIPNNPVNNLTNGLIPNPTCPGGCLALTPDAPFDFITMEIGNAPGTDLAIRIKEVNFISEFPIGGGQNQAVFGAKVEFFDETTNEILGVGSANSTFVATENESSWSGTFIVEEVNQPKVPEPSSLAGLAVLGLGALSLKKRANN